MFEHEDGMQRVCVCVCKGTVYSHDLSAGNISRL